MASLNKVMLIGNVTRDLELKYTQSGKAVTEVPIAVNEAWTDDNGQKQESTTFVDVTFWGRQAEVLGQYVRRGKALFIEGRLRLDSWEDKESGKKRSALKVTGSNFQFLGGKNDAGGERETPLAHTPAGARQAAEAGAAGSCRNDIINSGGTAPGFCEICNKGPCPKRLKAEQAADVAAPGEDDDIPF